MLVQQRGLGEQKQRSRAFKPAGCLAAGDLGTRQPSPGGKVLMRSDCDVGAADGALTQHAVLLQALAPQVRVQLQCAVAQGSGVRPKT